MTLVAGLRAAAYGIPFQPAIPARDESAEEFLRSTDLTPLRVWFLPRPEGVERSGKREAEERFADATADEIARLLASGAKIDGRPVHGGDIAVLVRIHEQGQQIRRALARRGIPAVKLSQESVFRAAEAEAIVRAFRRADGFEVDLSHVTVVGRCASCAARHAAAG